MPNTLAHVGAQGMATHEVLRDADPRWMYLGCVIPDLPRFLQRILLVAVPGIDPYALWAYLVVQASLFGGLLVCTAAALLTDRFWRTCAILEGNAALHLVLDALQTKWGTGVHFFAPVSWMPTNWGLFWPESITHLCVDGIGDIVHCLVRTGRHSPAIESHSARRGPISGDCPFAGRLRSDPPVSAPRSRRGRCAFPEGPARVRERVGHRVALDQARYVNTPDGPRLELYKGRVQLRVEKLDVQPPATVSVRGVLTGADTIRVTDHYVHAGRMRDYPSYLRLAFIAIVWTIAGWRAYRT